MQDPINELHTENLHREVNYSDDLDFYEYLEFITDKIDAISHRIEERKEKSLRRLRRVREEVEERKEESRQCLFRAKQEIEQQRKLLRCQLQKRVRIWSDNLKKPSFIRTRDKISFSIGVSNACFSPLIAGQWPHILPFIFTIQAVFLITGRFFLYKRKSWHYFLYDLCYFVNLLTLIYLWLLPSSTILFTVCYMLSHGPVGMAIIFWRNSLVFHSLDKVTSLFIHMYPPLTLFTLRWILPHDLRKEKYPAIDNAEKLFSSATTIYYTIAFYLFWQFLYILFIVIGRRKKVAQGLRATSYTWLLADKDGFVAHIIQRIGIGESNGQFDFCKIFVYFLLQFAYMLVSIIPVCFCYFHHKYANVAYLCAIFGVSVYNGASFYIDVFSRRYIKSLELLQNEDDHTTKDGVTEQNQCEQISSHLHAASKDTSDDSNDKKKI